MRFAAKRCESPGKSLQFVCTSPYFEEKGSLRYLSQGMPVCDGLAGVSKHFIPVVTAQTFCFRPGPADTNHFVVAHPVQGCKHKNVPLRTVQFKM